MRIGAAGQSTIPNQDKERRPWLGGLAPILGRAASLMAMGQPTIEIPFEIEHSQQSQCQIPNPCHYGQTWQGQGEEKGQGWKRKQGNERNHSTELIPFQPTCFATSAMAYPRHCSVYPAAIGDITNDTADHRDSCTETRSDTGIEECISRQFHCTIRDKGAHREDGEGCGKIRKRELKGNNKKFAHCNEIFGQSPKSPHGDIRGQESSPCTLDQAYHGCCENMGNPIARVQTATGFLPGSGGQSQSGHRICTECDSDTFGKSHHSDIGLNATDHSHQCRVGRSDTGRRPRCRDSTTTPPECSAELCRLPWHGSERSEYRTSAGDRRRQCRQCRQKQEDDHVLWNPLQVVDKKHCHPPHSNSEFGRCTGSSEAIAYMTPSLKPKVLRPMWY